MSLSAAVLDALVKSGASQDMLVAAMKADIAEREAADAAKLEAKRWGNRERQQRKRSKDGNAESRVTDVTARDERDGSPKEYNQTPSAKNSEPKGSSQKPGKPGLEVPDWVPAEPWAAFKEMRRKMRSVPFTETAERGIIDDLEKGRAEGHCPTKMLLKAVKNGHRAIFPDESTRAAKNGKVELSAQQLRERAEWFVKHGQPDRADECRRKAVQIEQRVPT